HLVDLRTKRKNFGEHLVSKLSPAALSMLRGPNADRVVTFSPLNLDFLPFESSILGLERPLARLPVRNDYGDFLIVNSMAISSASSRDGRSAAVMVSANGDSSEEKWAARIGEQIIAIAPFLGFSAASIEPNESVARVAAVIDMADLVFFVGHA